VTEEIISASQVLEKIRAIGVQNKRVFCRSSGMLTSLFPHLLREIGTFEGKKCRHAATHYPHLSGSTRLAPVTRAALSAGIADPENPAAGCICRVDRLHP
jgi:hypothetical protein